MAGLPPDTPTATGNGVALSKGTVQVHRIEFSTIQGYGNTACKTVKEPPCLRLLHIFMYDLVNFTQRPLCV